MKIFKVTPAGITYPSIEEHVLSNGHAMNCLILGSHGEGRKMVVVPLKGTDGVTAEDAAEDGIHFTDVSITTIGEMGSLALDDIACTTQKLTTDLEVSGEFLLEVECPRSLRGLAYIEPAEDALAKGFSSDDGMSGMYYHYLIKTNQGELNAHPIVMYATGRDFGRPSQHYIFLARNQLMVMCKEEYTLFMATQ